MKMEHSVDGLSGRHDGLGDNLTSIDTYQIPVTDRKGARSLVCTSHTYLSLLEEAACPYTGRGRPQGAQDPTTKLDPEVPTDSEPKCRRAWR